MENRPDAVPFERFQQKGEHCESLDAVFGNRIPLCRSALALQTHGAYVVDQGGARMAFTFETLPDATTNPCTVYTQAGFAWDYYKHDQHPLDTTQGPQAMKGGEPALPA